MSTAEINSRKTSQSQLLTKLVPLDQSLDSIILDKDVHFFNFVSEKEIQITETGLDNSLFKIYQDDKNCFWMTVLSLDNIFVGKERLVKGQKGELKPGENIYLRKDEDPNDDKRIGYTFIHGLKTEPGEESKKSRQFMSTKKKYSIIVLILSIILYVVFGEVCDYLQRLADDRAHLELRKRFEQEILEHERIFSQEMLEDKLAGVVFMGYLGPVWYQVDETWFPLPLEKPGEAKKVEFSNGDVYVGELKDGAPEGKGKMVWENGDRYEGGWKNGKPEGKGKMIWKNGEIYKGEWKDGVPDGRGKKKYMEYDIYVGDWKNGKRDGRGRLFTNEFGSFIEAEWKNDEQGGIFGRFDACG